VRRAILSFAISFSFLAVASAQAKTVPPKTNSQATTRAAGGSSGRLPVAGSDSENLLLKPGTALGKITLVLLIHSKGSPAPALH